MKISLKKPDKTDYPLTLTLHGITINIKIRNEREYDKLFTIDGKLKK